jgi:tRNA (adenine57-N1/adenine58-N1)-methyltransferase catalytic subunit
VKKSAKSGKLKINSDWQLQVQKPSNANLQKPKPPTMLETSPFFTPGARSKNGSLALLSLGRDQIPVLLRAPPPLPTAPAPDDDDAASAPPRAPAPAQPEVITNTRFGSYPHSTLTDVPWGAQVMASNVGAAERRRGKRRKLAGAKGEPDAATTTASPTAAPGAPAADGSANDGGAEGGGFAAAASGFAHLAVPTPESWTGVLQHRTQVVYVPDYAYILHLLRARPGCRLIECGAGSGSFTHAAARAVFSGYPPTPPAGPSPAAAAAAQGGGKWRSDFGKVFSFEYHEQRFKLLRREVAEHGLSSVVRVTHRDAYEGGFALDDEDICADAVFLDLPAPWSVPFRISLPFPTN